MTASPTPFDEAAIETIARRLYGQLPRLEKLWSEMNYVYLLDFAGRLPDKVIKCPKSTAGAGILREQAVMRSLAKAGLPVPLVEFTQQDDPAAPGPFTIMPRLGPLNLGQLYHTNKGSQTLRPWFVRLGQFLADLHRLDPDHIEGALSREAGWQRERQIHQRMRHTVAEHDLCWPGRDEFLEQMAVLIDRGPDGFVNNDMHPGNILCDGRSVFAAIDWEAAGWGFTLRDIGRCIAGTEVWFGLGADVLSGYLQCRPLSPQQRHELAAWRTYTFVDFLEFAARAKRPNGVKDMLDLLRREAADQRDNLL